MNAMLQALRKQGDARQVNSSSLVTRFVEGPQRMLYLQPASSCHAEGSDSMGKTARRSPFATAWCV